MKKLLTVGLCLLFCGCFTTTPEVSAPKDMLGTVKALRQSVSDCFKSKKFTTEDIKCEVNVKLVAPDAGNWNGIPLFNIEGKKVAGVTYSICKGGANIQIAQRADGFWSSPVLQHELCHAEDSCLICNPKDHAIEYRACCPHWPYLGSSALNINEIDVHEQNRLFCFTMRVSSNEQVTAIVPQDHIDAFSTMDVEWYKKVAKRFK